MKRLIVGCLLLVLFSCCSRKMIPVKSEMEHRTVERITDTVTQSVPDSAMIRALLECDSLGRVRVRDLYTKNGRLVRLNMQLQDNLLDLQARGESQQRVRETIRTDTIYKSVEVPVIVKEPVIQYRLRWWQKWLVWMGLFYLIRTGIRISLNWTQITFKNLLKLF